MTINKATTVKEIMADWLEKSERPNLKPSSFDRKENSCKWQIYPYIGSIPAKKLDNNDVEDLIQLLLAKGYSYSTIKKAIEAIGACYRYYRLHHKLTNTPTDGVRVPSGGRNKIRRIRFYSFEQLQMIQKECLRMFGNGVPVYPQGDLLVILINTGMRVGELLALSWPDVDLCRRLITIDKNAIIVKERNEQKENHYKQIIQDSTKTSSGIRTIPMNNEAYAAFVRLAALYGKRGLIAKTRNGKPLLVGNVERTLKRVLQNLNFPEDGWYNVHALRHSFATALLAKGADIKKVSEILGHSSVQITYDYYIHFIPKDYADTVKLLDFS